MKLKDLLEIRVLSVDVYENVADLVGVAFEWDKTMELTDEGKKHFKLALNYEVAEINNHLLIMDTEKSVPKDVIDKYDFETKIPKATQNLIEFFWSFAGYCSASNYDKWFKDIS